MPARTRAPSRGDRARPGSGVRGFGRRFGPAVRQSPRAPARRTAATHRARWRRRVLKPDLSPPPVASQCQAAIRSRCVLDDTCQGTPLVMEEIQREPGIELRIVQTPALELPILVVLHQVVIRIAGKGERIEPQRIHRRHAQEPKVGFRRLDLWEIEGDQVVSRAERQPRPRARPVPPTPLSACRPGRPGARRYRDAVRQMRECGGPGSRLRGPGRDSVAQVFPVRSALGDPSPIRSGGSPIDPWRPMVPAIGFAADWQSLAPDGRDTVRPVCAGLSRCHDNRMRPCVIELQ